MKKQLYIMVGVPGSGKSTYANKNLKPTLERGGNTVKYISRDIIRLKYLKDGDEHFAKENEVYNEFIDEIIDGFIHFDCTIADATHLSKGSRAKLLGTLYEDIKDYDVEVTGVVMDTAPSVCIDRNHEREGRMRVPDNIMTSMINAFTIPKTSEGFNNILITTGD